MQERAAQRGAAGLSLALGFDELAALESSRAYLCRTLDIQTLELRASQSEDDGAVPGEPIFVFA